MTDAEVATVPISGGFNPNLIGKLIIMQAFIRDDETDEIQTETLTKHVGILEYYCIDPETTVVIFRGRVTPLIFFPSNYYELFEVDTSV